MSREKDELLMRLFPALVEEVLSEPRFQDTCDTADIVRLLLAESHGTMLRPDHHKVLVRRAAQLLLIWHDHAMVCRARLTLVE